MRLRGGSEQTRRGAQVRCKQRALLTADYSQLLTAVRKGCTQVVARAWRRGLVLCSALQCGVLPCLGSGTSHNCCCGQKRQVALPAADNNFAGVCALVLGTASGKRLWHYSLL